MKCYTCEKGNLKRIKSEFKLYGLILGKFNSEVCDKCGQTFFGENASNAIDKVAKQKGLWGLDAKTKVA
ncbi:hypothetical protein HY643_03015 [Candidatus Woesearchaeota archaeon]|nr:hypothetical protein [Candidatus Woesearchaeota archaeon]